MSTAGKHGEASEWTAPDGTRWARASLVLRGQVWEMDESARLGADGMIARYTARGVSPQGDVSETFEIAGGKAEWKSQIDQGSARTWCWSTATRRSASATSGTPAW